MLAGGGLVAAGSDCIYYIEYYIALITGSLCVFRTNTGSTQSEQPGGAV